MPFKSVLDPGDLAVLRAVFDKHCRKFGISSQEGRDSVAASLMVHYQNGVSDAGELEDALDSEERSANGLAVRPVPLD